LAPILCQLADLGIPLMLPAALVEAAWAEQPDSVVAFMSEISRQLAQVQGGVPHALDNMAVRVCQRFLPLGIEAYLCNTQAGKHPVWYVEF